MNCPKCGNPLQPNAQFCNLCNEPIAQPGYHAYEPSAQGGYSQGYAPQNYQQPTGYDASQNYVPAHGYPPQGYPQGYGGYEAPPRQNGQAQVPMYGGYAAPPARNDFNAILSAVSHLPRMLMDSFRSPGAVLQGMVERRDLYTAPVVVLFTLLLSFLCATVATRGGISLFLTWVTSISRQTLASRDGINSLASTLSVPVGGIAALCQLLAILIPLAVTLVYLCAGRKVRFSWELLCGLTTVLTLPTIPGSLLCMVLSLLSPELALLPILSCMVISYTFMGSLAAYTTGREESGLVGVKIIMTLISLLLTLLLLALVINLLSSGIFHVMLVRLGLL